MLLNIAYILVLQHPAFRYNCALQGAKPCFHDTCTSFHDSVVDDTKKQCCKGLDSLFEKYYYSKIRNTFYYKHNNGNNVI